MKRFDLVRIIMTRPAKEVTVPQSQYHNNLFIWVCLTWSASRIKERFGLGVLFWFIVSIITRTALIQYFVLSSNSVTGTRIANVLLQIFFTLLDKNTN